MGGDGERESGVGGGVLLNNTVLVAATCRSEKITILKLVGTNCFGCCSSHLFRELLMGISVSRFSNLAG